MVLPNLPEELIMLVWNGVDDSIGTERLGDIPTAPQGWTKPNGCSGWPEAELKAFRDYFFMQWMSKAYMIKRWVHASLSYERTSNPAEGYHSGMKKDPGARLNPTVQYFCEWVRTRHMKIRQIIDVLDRDRKPITHPKQEYVELGRRIAKDKLDFRAKYAEIIATPNYDTKNLVGEAIAFLDKQRHKHLDVNGQMTLTVKQQAVKDKKEETKPVTQPVTQQVRTITVLVPIQQQEEVPIQEVVPVQQQEAAIASRQQDTKPVIQRVKKFTVVTGSSLFPGPTVVEWQSKNIVNVCPVNNFLTLWKFHLCQYPGSVLFLDNSCAINQRMRIVAGHLMANKHDEAKDAYVDFLETVVMEGLEKIQTVEGPKWNLKGEEKQFVLEPLRPIMEMTMAVKCSKDEAHTQKDYKRLGTGVLKTAAAISLQGVLDAITVYPHSNRRCNQLETNDSWKGKGMLDFLMSEEKENTAPKHRRCAGTLYSKELAFKHSAFVLAFTVKDVSVEDLQRNLPHRFSVCGREYVLGGVTLYHAQSGPDAHYYSLALYEGVWYFFNGFSRIKRHLVSEIQGHSTSLVHYFRLEY